MTTPNTTRPEPVTITIYADVQDFAVNSVSQKTWHMMAQRRKAARGLGKAAWLNAGKPRFDRRVRVDAHVCRSTGRLLDEPNIWAALKGFIDGICTKHPTTKQPRLVPDDNPNWLKCGEITQASSRAQKGRERIELTFTPIEPFDGGSELIWNTNASKEVATP